MGRVTLTKHICERRLDRNTMIDNEITIKNDDWHLLIVTGFHKSQMDENQIYLDREDNIFQR